MSMRSFI